MDDVQQRIDAMVKGHRVMLFMKGTAQFPMCGFSGRAIQILKAVGAKDVSTFNVLEDEGVRQGIKVAEPMERYVRKLYDNGRPLPQEGLSLLRDTVRSLENVVDHADEDTGFFPDHGLVHQNVV